MSDKDNTKNVNNRGRVLIISPRSYLINAQYFGAISEMLDYETKISTTDKIEQALSEIKEFSPNFIVFKVTFDKFRVQLEFMQNIKQILPSCKIIALGEPFLTYNNNVTYENPYIDYVIFGEAEYTLRDILEGEQDNEVLGISYTDDNMQSVKNEQRPFIENLDNLPYPARHLTPNNTEITIELSRGCPCHCFFCLETPIYGKTFRQRTVNNVISELKECISKFNTKKVYFKSNIFNFDKDYVTDLCNQILENNINIEWSCDIVPNNIDETLIKLMKKSGCKLCKLGIESGSADILKNIGKNITKESVTETVRLLKKYKIKTKAYYVIGLPWETEETAKETIDFAIKLNTDDAVFNIGVPFPGTNFFIYGMLNKLFSNQTQFNNAYKNALVKSHSLSKERISELRNLAEKTFYSQPNKIIKNILNRIIKFFK